MCQIAQKCVETERKQSCAGVATSLECVNASQISQDTIAEKSCGNAEGFLKTLEAYQRGLEFMLVAGNQGVEKDHENFSGMCSIHCGMASSSFEGSKGIVSKKYLLENDSRKRKRFPTVLDQIQAVVRCDNIKRLAGTSGTSAGFQRSKRNVEIVSEPSSPCYSSSSSCSS